MQRNRRLKRDKRSSSKSLELETTVIDAVKRKGEIERLKDFNERIIRCIEEGILINDVNGYITFVNPKMVEMLGYMEHELLGKHWKKIVPPAYYKKVEEEISRRPRGEKSSYEICLLSKDGKEIPVIVSATPIFEDGRYAGDLAAFTDITERKKAEEEINYMRLLDQCQSFISTKFITEKKIDRAINESLKILGETVKVNRVYLFMIRENEEVIDNTHEWCSKGTTSQIENMQGLKGETFPWWAGKLLKNEAIIVSDINKLPPEAEAERKVLETQNVRSLVVVPIYLEGELKGFIGFDDTKRKRKWKEEEVALLRTVAGILISAIRRKQAEKELKEYAENLEALVQQRTRALKESQEKLLKSQRMATIGEIAAMVGHDLRNPLTGIAGAAYYLKMHLGPKIDKKSREMLKVIEKDIEYANKIINDLLELSKEIRLELTPTTLKSIIRETLSQIEIPKNVQIRNKIHATSRRIIVDKNKIKRVFLNLIKNALDAMPNGGRLEIRSEEEEEALKITVCDTGIGIPKEMIKKIWTPFFTTKAKGLGLGLPICKRIIEAHGGTITVKSRKGKGTCFTIKIPYRMKGKK
jgi:PAS domain S-box-containing protein